MQAEISEKIVGSHSWRGVNGATETLAGATERGEHTTSKGPMDIARVRHQRWRSRDFGSRDMSYASRDVCEVTELGKAC